MNTKASITIKNTDTDSIRSQPRCQFCGRYFRPDSRVGKRQKACQREKCQKARKRFQERQWLAKDPEYFRKRSENTRIWRQEHPGYQRAWRARKRSEIQTQIRPESPLKSIRIHLRGMTGWGEIQTQIARLTFAEDGLWVDGIDLQGLRDTNADRQVKVMPLSCGP